MQIITLRTTQNVLINYPVAGLFDGIFTFLIDLFIFASLILAIYAANLFRITSTWVFILIYLPACFNILNFKISMNRHLTSAL